MLTPLESEAEEVVAVVFWEAVVVVVVGVGVARHCAFCRLYPTSQVLHYPLLSLYPTSQV
jgi:hypothetical protein